MTGNARLAGRAVWVMAKGYAPDEGGMQTYARAVAGAYAAAGASVTVFTRTSVGPREAMLDGVRLVDLGPVRGIRLYLRVLARLRQELRRHGAPALLHGTTWRTSVVPMLLGLDYVTTFHGRELMYPHGWQLQLMRAVARRARRVVAVSHFTAAALQRRVPRLDAEPIVAWNGVTPGTLQPAAAEPGTMKAGTSVPLVLSLCRLEPRKNLLAAVEAAAACHDEGLAFRFVLAGRGEQYEPLREAIARRGLGDVVELAGFVATPRALELYAAADVFIHPHVTRDGGRDFEGFGIAAADAMYARTAVIVGRAGGGAELIEHGVSGLGVDGERQAEVDEALRRLLRDPDLRRTLADAAALRAQREFSWPRHVALIVAGLAAAP